MNVPEDLAYTAEHEWVAELADGRLKIGITDYAQDALGDVVFVELPEPGAQLAAGDEAGVVESVKAASDIYAPVGGEVLEINESLEDSPENVNSDPYTDGWFFRLRIEDPSELENLLSAEDYDALCAEES